MLSWSLDGSGFTDINIVIVTSSLFSKISLDEMWKMEIVDKVTFFLNFVIAVKLFMLLFYFTQISRTKKVEVMFWKLCVLAHIFFCKILPSFFI